MSNLTPTAGGAAELEGPVRVRIPADLDTPDRVAFGLTVRQLAVVVVFAVPAYLAWQTLTGVLPLPVLAAGTAPLAAFALALAVGRRDGLPLDGWLLAAVSHRRRPRRLSPTGHDDTRHPGNLPAWAPTISVQRNRRRPRPGRRSGTGAGPRVGVLRLPVSGISRDGVITGERSGPAVVLVAARTLTSGLHTPAEQAGLLGGYARWLNQLSGPTQVVVSSRPVDLPGRALRIAQDATRAPHPALAQAALGHAEHLLDLCQDGQPRARIVTIACTTTPTHAASAGTGAGARAGAGGEALRRAERTVAALAGLGAECAVLDGDRALGVLAAAIDPFGPGGTWPRARTDEPLTNPTLTDTWSDDQWSSDQWSSDEGGRQ